MREYRFEVFRWMLIPVKGLEAIGDFQKHQGVPFMAQKAA
jgi:hypothetical protein